ncbi:MAG: methyltransferase [Ktedonobacterales bacterium]
MIDLNSDSREGSPFGAEPTVEEQAAAAAVLRLIQGIHISQAVYVAAELGIADLLASGPQDAADLAQATETHEPSLYRVLRLLAALGLFTEVQPARFSLTPLGDRLRTGVPASMRAWAMLVETLGGVRSFEYLLHTVRTGEPGLKAAYGVEVFEFLAERPENARRFDATMSARTAAFASSVAAGYDFSPMRNLVDVGGGNGMLLAVILQRHPHLQGTLFDTAAVVSRASATLENADVADRCRVIAGDFFAAVPEGADGYLLANVLHDWDDNRAVAILRNCRSGLPKDGRVLVIERLIPEDPSAAAPTLLSDINMLVFTGGRERTNAEYESLFNAAGLRLSSVQPVVVPYGVLEGIAV